MFWVKNAFFFTVFIDLDTRSEGIMLKNGFPVERETINRVILSEKALLNQHINL